MTSEKRILKKDRLKDRSDIGEVEFPIEKLMKLRDASASCVHIEAGMEADRGSRAMRKLALLLTVVTPLKLDASSRSAKGS